MEIIGRTNGVIKCRTNKSVRITWYFSRRYAKITPMEATASPLANWTPEQIAKGKQWAQTWEKTGELMEAMRREELRNIDGLRAIEMLCGPADYSQPPYAPKPTSGLIEQQFWFKKAARCD